MTFQTILAPGYNWPSPPPRGKHTGRPKGSPNKSTNKNSVEYRLYDYINKNPGASKAEIGRHFLGQIEGFTITVYLYRMKKWGRLYAKKISPPGQRGHYMYYTTEV